MESTSISVSPPDVKGDVTVRVTLMGKTRSRTAPLDEAVLVIRNANEALKSSDKAVEWHNKVRSAMCAEKYHAYLNAFLNYEDGINLKEFENVLTNEESEELEGIRKREKLDEDAWSKIQGEKIEREKWRNAGEIEAREKDGWEVNPEYPNDPDQMTKEVDSWNGEISYARYQEKRAKAEEEDREREVRRILSSR